jgi:tetratricopeptide (TPR) repeat protein
MKTKALKSLPPVRAVKSRRIASECETVNDDSEKLSAASTKATGDRKKRGGSRGPTKARIADNAVRRTEALRFALADARKLLAKRGIRCVVSTDETIATSKQLAYDNLISRIRDVVRKSLPADATVAVVNKGDAELLKLDGRVAWHFPRTAHGDYTGHHPASSGEAIEHLEALRADGAQYLLFPSTAYWWLDYYGEFRTHLETHYPVVAQQEETCMIFSLTESVLAMHVRPAPEAVAETHDEPANECSDAEIRVELAKVMHSLGRPEEAQRILAEGLEVEPSNAVLHAGSIKMALAAGDYARALREGSAALEVAPDDRAVNMGIAKAAWKQGRFAEVEERLTHLATVSPADATVMNELVQFYCARLEIKNPEPALADRFLVCLADPAHRRLITAENHLRITEVLGIHKYIEPALASLQAALGQIDFSSRPLQEFTGRLLHTVIADKATIPFHDPAALAAFLTHVGNGFISVRDNFRAENCYHLALAAQCKNWDSATWAASFNLAFMEMARGAVAPALQHLRCVSRIYGRETARIVWPAQDHRPWPHAPFDLAARFEELRPASMPWPKITVITPSFNQADYVEETLLSVLHQNYPELEYIVVDGVSTDGSIEILKRYQPRLSRLIIESDGGQTDALNKGLRLATGEVLLWVNSDDMLGPGALFMIALTFLEEQADVIAGFCCEHGDRRFGLINLPAVSQATFNIECLGDIFHYWLKGHYFYQPEVAFSRRIFEKAGSSLDERLYYTMDYEFWLRCAKEGARLSVVHWPIGLFRKHDQQKTANLDRTVIEQATVRDRFVIPEARVERRLEIKGRLRRAFAKSRPVVSVVSSRADRFFSADTARQLRETFAGKGFDVTFGEDLCATNSAHADLILLLIHLHKEGEPLRKLREGGCDAAVLGWFWDNHHHVFDNYSVGKDLDVCIAGHGFAASYLRSPRHMAAPAVPLCVTQWSDDEATEFFRLHRNSPRSDALYGGFIRYRFAVKRNRLIESLTEEGFEGVYFLDEDRLAPYFGKTPSQRFAEWASRKTSLCLPLNGDLSMRFFDALLAGQVPIVPRDIGDFDSVIPPEWQERLPVIRFDDYTSAAVREAHAAALSAFDRLDAAGVRERHAFVMQHHMFTSRIRSILGIARKIGDGGTAAD